MTAPTEGQLGYIKSMLDALKERISLMASFELNPAFENKTNAIGGTIPYPTKEYRAQLDDFDKSCRLTAAMFVNGKVGGAAYGTQKPELVAIARKIIENWQDPIPATIGDASKLIDDLKGFAFLRRLAQ